MLWIVVLLCLLPGSVLANDWSALEQPGTIAIMRHALAPGTGDPPEFRLGDCSTQRNLSEKGRQQARSIGEAFRKRGIVFEQILTSQWCRTRETAELLDLGPVSGMPALNSFFQDFSSQDRQTRAMRDLIETEKRRLLLVSHQVNISALAGRGTRSGEVLIIRNSTEGIEVLGSILIEP